MSDPELSVLIDQRVKEVFNPHCPVCQPSNGLNYQLIRICPDCANKLNKQIDEHLRAEAERRIREFHNECFKN